jgi:thymidylate synthase ThyX
MPEAYKTSLVMTINARSLQNFLEQLNNIGEQTNYNGTNLFRGKLCLIVNDNK